MGGGVSKSLVQQYEFACDADAKKYLEALQLSHQQGILFYKLFAQIDKDHSNSVDLREIYNHFQIERSVFTDIALGVFNGGEAGDREVKFHDFFVSVWNYCTVTNKQLKKLVFSVFDDSGDGELEKAEFDGLVRMLFNVKELDDRLKQIIAEADKDGSGSLSFDEFCTITDNHPEVLEPAFNLQKTFLQSCLTPELWEKEKIKRANLWAEKGIDEILARAAKLKEKALEAAEKKKSKEEDERKQRIATREDTRRKRQEEEEQRKLNAWTKEHQEPELIAYRQVVTELAEANYVYNRALKGETLGEAAAQSPAGNQKAEEQPRDQVNMELLQLKVTVTLRQNAADLGLGVLEARWKADEEKEVPVVREAAADKALMAISADDDLVNRLEKEATKMIWTYKNVMKRPPPTWDEAVEMVEEDFCDKQSLEAENKCRAKYREYRKFLEAEIGLIKKSVTEKHKKAAEQREREAKRLKEEAERKKSVQKESISSAIANGDAACDDNKMKKQRELLAPAELPPPPPPYVRPPIKELTGVEPYRDAAGRLWLLRRDPELDRSYFHCPETGQQEWEMPEGLQPETEAIDPVPETTEVADTHRDKA